MVSKNNKRVFLEKTKKRVLKYSIKKLSVGVASVLIGVGLVLGTTELVKAQDEISPSSPLETAISSVQVGDKVASGNTFQENPGYTKNYNFSDLQFSPQELTGDTLKGNTIGFEVYGKHNIAASTKNWEIRLQLDERLAKYVEKIQVDPKKGIGSSRRTFVRINDSLGRPTNIWKVNYIRASDGLFAGAETTDTQTAPNGVITFEKSLDEIFKEIGIDNLKTDRLMYRIYLVSHQDDDKIVPGIDSTGYFLTDSDDFYNSLDVSENNPDQFKHGSVSAKYEKPNTQTKDGSGSTGANGAIILDHKLTKNYNFSYSSSAKGTPWYANYKIDERLVPYVAGIQMHMVQADKVTYDVSFESGTKVADLAIERREGHENYGIGSITNNDLTKLIDFANASPRPVVIRYVLQLTKPLDEILEDMKATAQVEENKPFGEDFIFDSWLSDTNKKLIQNTYGTGYYYLQDIDGDGNPDDKEESGDTNPYIGKPELEEVYDVDTTVKGKVFIHELAGTGHKAQLVDKEGTVLAEKTIAPNEKDGAPISDTVEFEFTGVDSSKLIAKDELKIQIVSPGFDKPEEGSTVIKESPKAVDKQTVVVGFKPDAKESIRNNKNLPEDAEYSWKTEPDTSNVTDSTKGIVTVKIGNRTFDVDVEFAVKASQAMENDATYVPITTTPETTVQSGKPTFDKPDVPLAKDAFSISDVYNKDFGNASVDANTGIVTFTPAKGVGESEPITGTIPIKIVYQDGSVGTTDLAVTVSKDIYENPGENIPAGYHKVTFTAGEGTSIESGTTVFAVKDGVSLPEDKLPVLKAKDGYTDAKWPEEATQPITADDTEFVSSATKLDDIIENPGENIPAGYHKVTFTAGEGTSIESGTTVFAVKDGVSLPEDKLPVLKAKDGYTDAKWPEEATQPITADDTEFVSSATKLDDKSDADKYNPEGQKVTTELNKEPDAFEGIKNKEDLPKDTKYTWKEKVDVSAAGNKKGTVVVTYPDGSSDEVEVDVTVTDNRSDADKYEPTVEGEKVEVGGTVDLTDNVTNLPTLPEGTTVTDVTPGGTIDTNTPGNYEGVIEVTYPDGTKDTVKVPVEVTDNRSDADKYTPMVEGEKVEVGGTVDLTDNVTNLPTLPEGTTVTDVTPGGTIDTNTPGNYEGVIEVTYPDGTKDTVKVPVEVTDNRSDADKYEPTVEGEKVEVGGTVDLTDNVTNLPALPEGTTVTDVTPGGTIDTNTPGNYEGVIEVTYPDGTKDTVKVPVEVTDNRSDADKYEPTVEGEKVEIGGTVDLTDNVTNLPALPEGTTVTDVTPGGTIDTNTPGNYEGVIEVTYPDGTKDTVKVPVEVTDNRSNADKYNPEGQKVTTDLNKEPDASEGIKNKEDLPKGTTYAWKEKVDVSTAGNKKGTIVVTYPDGSSDEVEVDVTVTDTRSDADKYNPEGQKVTTDLNKEPDASEGIKNKEDLPKGTTYTWKEKVDVSTAGNKKGTVVVTYPDGSKEEVEVTISVVDKKAPNKPQVDPITEGDQIVTGKTEPNAEVTVTLPDGSQHHGTADKNGNFTVKVPKLEAGTKVIVTATDESGNTSEPTNVVVSSNKKDSGKNGSKGSKTDNQGSNSNQDKNRGKSQSSKVFPKTGESDSNIFTISGGLILLGTLGLLGYKNRKKENE
ncbi:YSIRK-type signal peptide-containing protein [Enterococcus faecium]|uniref:Rib/alpha-like domain-containing protein n=1 Tax=Enterococcus faecium TaxID=1352 RepID=UPI0018CA6254|nr:Rib/alpha-like domain-containing protein [Enterococcus faecium]MBG7775926.1 YSIRK-type signal peptide-containing protein [Enterococcus faecium]MBG8130345.1 YSIRK-type signal peptide-containing protein [Enterococcus faecium]MBG8144489.1 YSIRK-type signal peptide-containing protein [Enterococcus faecium]MBG8241125.1 YSIRK-type signal peptide-containing protein [Enterococcus faecium]MBH0875827.1 YSIRK-type signal peptide-containing protein [Enterococcus faecium]